LAHPASFPRPAAPFAGEGKRLVAAPNGTEQRLAELRERAARNGLTGVREISLRELRGIEPEANGIAALQHFVPAICAGMLVPRAAGIRAQALRPDGSLVDDFHFAEGDGSLHVLNAPSPAATAALAIGSRIAERYMALRR
jgi:L-2-hydroxyglutarate oxidase LhgO